MVQNINNTSLFHISINRHFVRQKHTSEYQHLQQYMQNPFTRYRKSSPLKILREHHQEHKNSVKMRKKRIKHNKYLRQDIENNKNIFHNTHKSFSHKKTMTVQNIIWQKNYHMKININSLREQNNSIKAKLWNVSKENRRMNKQIYTWNLNSIPITKMQTQFNSLNSHAGPNSFQTSSQLIKKPYVDMATVQKVSSDQDYSIVSTKISIGEYQKLLQGKQNQISLLEEKAQKMQIYLKDYDYQSADMKQQIFQCFLRVSNQDTCGYQSLQFDQDRCQQIKQKIEYQIMQSNRQDQILRKNIQLIKKTKNQQREDLSQIAEQCETHKQITRDSIEQLGKQIIKMRKDQQQDVADFKQRLKIATNNRIAMQCAIQDRMGDLIRKKIQIQSKIQMKKSELCQVIREVELRRSFRMSAEVQSDDLQNIDLHNGSHNYKGQ